MFPTNQRCQVGGDETLLTYDREAIKECEMGDTGEGKGGTRAVIRQDTRRGQQQELGKLPKQSTSQVIARQVLALRS